MKYSSNDNTRPIIKAINVLKITYFTDNNNRAGSKTLYIVIYSKISLYTGLKTVVKVVIFSLFIYFNFDIITYSRS